MQLVLFALTGIGNSVLRALVESGRRPVLLGTREERGPFPYYAEEQIALTADRLGIPVLIGADAERETLRLKPDTIFAATYHRLIPGDVIASARRAFNLHPSLLPAYPGKNPFYWPLVRGERSAGVTMHRLTDRFDAGEILLQHSLAIAPDETQGSLRRRLAGLAGETTREFFLDVDSLPARAAFDASPAGPLFGQVGEAHRTIDLRNDAITVERQVRALSPWPCAVLRETGHKVPRVLAVEAASIERAGAGTILRVAPDSVRVRVANADMVLALGDREDP